MRLDDWLDPVRAALDAAPARDGLLPRRRRGLGRRAAASSCSTCFAARALPLDLAVIPAALDAGRWRASWRSRPGVRPAPARARAREPRARGAQVRVRARARRRRRSGATSRRAASGSPTCSARASTRSSPRPGTAAPPTPAAASPSSASTPLSREARAAPLGVPGLRELPVSVDWFAHRHGERLSLGELGARIARGDRLRRAGRRDVPPRGHGRRGDAPRGGAAERVAGHERARPVSMMELAGGAGSAGEPEPPEPDRRPGAARAGAAGAARVRALGVGVGRRRCRTRCRTSRCPTSRCRTNRCPTSRCRTNRCPTSRCPTTAARRTAARRTAAGRPLPDDPLPDDRCPTNRSPTSRCPTNRCPTTAPDEPLPDDRCRTPLPDDRCPTNRCRTQSLPDAPDAPRIRSRRAAAGDPLPDEPRAPTTRAAPRPRTPPGDGGTATARLAAAGAADAARRAPRAGGPRPVAACARGSRRARATSTAPPPAAPAITAATATLASAAPPPAGPRRRQPSGSSRSSGVGEQGGGRVADRLPRAVGELADRSGAHPEVGRDPLVALAVERVADDHLALLRRQRGHRADDAAQPLAPLHDLVGPLDAVEALGQLRRAPACGSRATFSAALCATRYSHGPAPPACARPSRESAA